MPKLELMYCIIRVVTSKYAVISVVQQRYEVQVYDEFVISGNTAVLRCHIPSYVRDYVAVVTWEREDGVTITSNVAVGE